MKIALLYSGLTQKFNRQVFDNHKKFILDGYEYDIYLSTWLDESNQYALGVLNPVVCSIENFSKISDSKFIDVHKRIMYKYPETNTENTIAMFYKIENCFNLVAQDDYDLIIRCRLDIEFDQKISLQNNDCVNIPFKGDYRGGINDLFGYGNYKNMRAYCTTYSRICSYLTNGICCHPETLLRHSLNEQGLCINRFENNLYLRGQLLTRYF